MALPTEEEKKRYTAFPHNPPPPGRVYGESQARGLTKPKAAQPAAAFGLENDTANIEGQFGRAVGAVFAPSGTPDQIARIRPGYEAKPVVAAPPSVATATPQMLDPLRVQEARNGIAQPSSVTAPASTGLRFGDASPAGTFGGGFKDMGGGIAGMGMTSNRTDGGPNGTANNFTNIGADGKPTAMSQVDPRTPDQIANGERIKAETAAALTKPDGTKWTQADNNALRTQIADNSSGAMRFSSTPGQRYIANMEAALGMPLKNIASKSLVSQIMAGAASADSSAQSGQEAQARLGLDRQRAGLDAAKANSEKAATDMALQERGLGLQSSKRIADLQARYMDPNVDPKTKEEIARTLAALTGKSAGAAKDNFIVVGGGQEADPATGQLRNVPQRLIDVRTGQEVGVPAGQKPSASAQQSFVGGQTYTDAQGNKARWDGEKFVPVK